MEYYVLISARLPRFSAMVQFCAEYCEHLSCTATDAKQRARREDEATYLHAMVDKIRTIPQFEINMLGGLQAAKMKEALKTMRHEYDHKIAELQSQLRHARQLAEEAVRSKVRAQEALSEREAQLQQRDAKIADLVRGSRGGAIKDR